MFADIHLQNFRSYKDESFEFAPGVNIIVGPNASGKTNLLEAILVLSQGRSYRVKDSSLIEFNNSWARLDSHLTNGSIRTLKLKTGDNLSKIYEIAGKEYKRLNINNSIPVVLFEPNHLLLLSGGPDKRREYLDELIEQTVSGYGAIRRQYKRALSQRNALLKHPSSSQAAHMFPWNVRLSQLAGQIVRQRLNISKQLNKELKLIYEELSKSSTKVSLEYQSRWPIDTYESTLLKTLDSNIDDDRYKGFTSIGPHREDMMVYFGKHLANETASRGENRTVVLALKITELRLIEESRDASPVLLLDDVFSELDGKRRHALTNYLSKYQTFITTTDADLVIHHFTESCNVIALSSG